MLERQRAISQTELQIATGKRILRPSDDPSASVRVLDLQEAYAPYAYEEVAQSTPEGHLDPWHPNRKGSRVVAYALYAEVVGRRLLDVTSAP